MGKKALIKKIIVIFLLFLTQSAYAQECVVLLHGYLRNSKCMNPIEIELIAKGYNVQNISYPSTDYSIEILSKEHIAPKIDHKSCDKIHFVGHSMGGIIIRHYLASNKIDNLGHVVLITTPNGGSTLVSDIDSNKAFAWAMLGEAVRQLAPESELLKNLPAPQYNVGIITASKSINPFTSIFMLEGPNDGTLTVESMKIPNAKDIIDFERNHTTVLLHPEISDQIDHFLKNGRFIK